MSSLPLSNRSIAPRTDLKALRPYIASSEEFNFPSTPVSSSSIADTLRYAYADRNLLSCAADFQKWTQDPKMDRTVDMLIQLADEVKQPVNIRMKRVIGRGIFMSGAPGVGKSTLFESFAA
jgi:hypothetical protein